MRAKYGQKQQLRLNNTSEQRGERPSRKGNVASKREADKDK